MQLAMDAVFALVGLAVPAFVVWQTVRIVNRRPNRRAILWSAAALMLFALYVASFGPAYWWQHSSGSRIVPVVYAPLVETAWRAPRFVINWLGWYASCAGSDYDKRLACSPLWRDGPRAFSWITVEIPGRPNAPTEAAPSESF
jgi:hypothetical protein